MPESNEMTQAEKVEASFHKMLSLAGELTKSARQVIERGKFDEKDRFYRDFETFWNGVKQTIENIKQEENSYSPKSTLGQTLKWLSDALDELYRRITGNEPKDKGLELCTKMDTTIEDLNRLTTMAAENQDNYEILSIISRKLNNNTWQELGNQTTLFDVLKTETAEKVIPKLEGKFPGLVNLLSDPRSLETSQSTFPSAPSLANSQQGGTQGFDSIDPTALSKAARGLGDVTHVNTGNNPPPSYLEVLISRTKGSPAQNSQGSFSEQARNRKGSFSEQAQNSQGGWQTKDPSDSEQNRGV